MKFSKQEITEHIDFYEYYSRQLHGVRPVVGEEMLACCPFHDDANPSLSVNVKNGLWHCFSCKIGGDVFDFYKRIHNVGFAKACEGLAAQIVCSDGQRGEKDKQTVEVANATDENCTAQYDYLDTDGRCVYSVLRFEETGKKKTFRMWHKHTETGEWIQKVKGIKRIPYQLPEIIRAETVYIVEGEKDVEALRSIGFTATTSPQGVGSWSEEFSVYFTGKRVIIIPDNDEQGRKHAQDIFKKLLPHTAGIRVVELPNLPEKGDVSDWINAGGTPEELHRIVLMVSEDTPPTPPFSFATLDIDGLRAGRYIATKPGKIQWTLHDSLPQGSLGFIVSNGGVGKSFFLIQIAMSVATHLDCLDGIFEIEERGKVFAILGEDSQNVIHARTQSIFKNFMTNPPEGVRHIPTSERQYIAELNRNLFILDGVGKDLRLMKEEGGNVVTTKVYDDLLALLKSVKGLKLVIFDPVSRFYAGSENDNVIATFFCSLLERISNETGATVLISHHTNKAATNPSESSYNSLHQGAIRGASGFTNAARWQVNLTPLKRKEVLDAGGDPAQYINYLAGKVVKKNVGKPETTFWIERQEGGVLRRFISSLEGGDTDVAVKSKIVSLIGALERDGDRVTRRGFARSYSEKCGISRAKLADTIDVLVGEDRLRVVECKNEKGRLTDYISVGTVNGGGVAL